MIRHFATVSLLLLYGIIYSQNIYQNIYGTEIDVQCFGAIQTIDDGLLTVGIINDNGSKSYVSKTDCSGKVLWTRTFEFSSTVGNIFHRVIECKDRSIVFATNSGTYQDYNMHLIKMDIDGNTIWHKVMQASRDDKIADVIETPEGDYILVGATNSYGEDTNNSLSYKDIYVSKLSKDGALIWSKTIGNQSNIDEATDINITGDGHYIITGRFIDKGAFFVLLLKMTSDGEIIFLKTFGAENHRNYGFGIIETKDNSYLITGGSTLNKENHQSYMDVFLIKTDQEGQLKWSKTYTAIVDDRSDIGTSIIETDIEQYVIACQTLSYPSSGFVPNKHLLLITDASGFLMKAKTFNDGYSHYTYIAPSINGDINHIVGFSNSETNTFSAHVIRTNDKFESGCNEVDRTDNTLEESVEFKSTTPDYQISEGANWADSFTEGSFNLDVLSICKEIMDTLCYSLSSIKEISIQNIHINLYPNPNSDYFYLTLDNLISATTYFSLYDYSGTLRHQNVINFNEGVSEKIDIGHLSSGLYIIKLQVEEQHYSTKLIIR